MNETIIYTEASGAQLVETIDGAFRLRTQKGMYFADFYGPAAESLALATIMAVDLLNKTYAYLDQADGVSPGWRPRT